MIKGFGFVNSGTTQAKFDGVNGHIVTNGNQDAISDAKFIDKNNLETVALP